MRQHPAAAVGRRTYCLTELRVRRKVCTPEPVPSARVEAEAKRFEPSSGSLTIFIVRSAHLDAARVLNVTINEATSIGTLPHSLIRARVQPGEHLLGFEWNNRIHRIPVRGVAGEVRFIELAGSSWPFERSYHWSDADPAGAKLRAAGTRLIADG
jgi:hypothetical protein